MMAQLSYSPTFERIVSVSVETQDTRHVHVEMVEEEPIDIILKTLHHHGKFSRWTT